MDLLILHLNTEFEMEPMQRYDHNFIKNTTNKMCIVIRSRSVLAAHPSQTVQVSIMYRKGVWTAANTNDTIFHTPYH